VPEAAARHLVRVALAAGATCNKARSESQS
jgi:hypothetical protein